MRGWVGRVLVTFAAGRTETTGKPGHSAFATGVIANAVADADVDTDNVDTSTLQTLGCHGDGTPTLIFTAEADEEGFNVVTCSCRSPDGVVADSTR